MFPENVRRAKIMLLITTVPVIRFYWARLLMSECAKRNSARITQLV